MLKKVVYLIEFLTNFNFFFINNIAFKNFARANYTHPALMLHNLPYCLLWFNKAISLFSQKYATKTSQINLRCLSIERVFLFINLSFIISWHLTKNITFKNKKRWKLDNLYEENLWTRSTVFISKIVVHLISFSLWSASKI